jgi:hypothetical protein
LPSVDRPLRPRRRWTVIELPPASATVVAAKTLSLLAGGLVTVLATRAYQRTRAAPLRALAVGFGLFTVGALFGGGLHYLLGTDLATGVVVQSVFTALGLGALVYSLYAEGSTLPLDGSGSPDRHSPGSGRTNR